MQTKTFYKILLLACFFTFISYMNYKIKYPEIVNAWDYVKLGYPQARALFLSNDFFKEYPYLFVIIFWSVVGFTMYLFYFSVNLIYRNIRNWEIVETYYTKPAHIEGFHFRTFLKRVTLHMAVVFVYLLFLLLTLFVIFPVTKKIYLAANFSSELLSNLPIFMLWLLILSLFAFSITFIDKQMQKEQEEEEHGLADIENMTS